VNLSKLGGGLPLLSPINLAKHEMGEKERGIDCAHTPRKMTGPGSALTE